MTLLPGPGAGLIPPPLLSQNEAPSLSGTAGGPPGLNLSSPLEAVGALDPGPVGPASAVSLSSVSSLGDGACPTLIQDRLGPLVCGPPAAYPRPSRGHWAAARSYCVSVWSPASLPDFKAGVPSPQLGGGGWEGTPASSFSLPAPSSLPGPGCKRGQEREGSRGTEGGLFERVVVKSCPLFGATLKRVGPCHTWSADQEEDFLLWVEISPPPSPSVPSHRPQAPASLCTLGPGWGGVSSLTGRVLRSLRGLLGEGLSCGPFPSSDPPSRIPPEVGPTPTSHSAEGTSRPWEGRAWQSLDRTLHRAG